MNFQKWELFSGSSGTKALDKENLQMNQAKHIMHQ